MAGKSTLLEALTNSGGENGTVSLTKKGVSILRCTLSVPVLSLPLPFPFPCLCLSLPYPSPACLRTEEVKSRMELLQTASSTLKASERRVSKGDMSEEALSALAAVVAAFEAAICYTADHLVSNVLCCAAWASRARTRHGTATRQQADAHSSGVTAAQRARSDAAESVYESSIWTWRRGADWPTIRACCCW